MRRLSFLRRHLAFAILAALAIPAIVGFCWHSVLATLGDDSVSYLVLARHLSPWRSDPLAAPWVGYFSNFPPLFPSLLALTDGAYNLFTAHMVVAGGAVASFVLTYAYARERLSRTVPAIAVAVLFLLLPGTWLGLKGILSESTYLALTLAALLYQASRVHPGSPPRTYVILGLWIAAALLTRAAGLALVVAYAAQIAFVALRKRRYPAARLWIPLAIAVGAQLAWLAVRPPLAVTAYENTLGHLTGLWFSQPGATFSQSWEFLSRGWMGAFAADAGGGARTAVAFALVAVAAIVGAIRAAARGRLDGWYMLASAAMLLAWKFNEDNSRRLLYPLLPIVLLHATESVLALAARFNGSLRRWIPVAAFAFLAAMVLPASALIAAKALDREPYFPGLGYSPSSMKDYYGNVNDQLAREEARIGASVLGGMSLLHEWTPPGSRVMWVRPEYVAVMGRREGVPLLLRWDRATLARQIRSTRTQYVIASRQYKNDLATDTADAFLWIAKDLPDYLVPQAALPDAEQGDFVLLRVDPARLDRYIRDTEGAPPGPPGPAR